MIILIPLGGIGERFKKDNYKEPKALIKINNKPIIFYLIDTINTSEEDIIYIPYNYKEYNEYNFEELIMKEYPNKQFLFTKLMNNTEGAAHTINIALKKLELEDTNILCIDSDSFCRVDIIREYKKNENKNNIFTIIDNNEHEIYSYIQSDNNLEIIDIQEKVKISNKACIGSYGFESYKELLYYTEEIIKKEIKSKNEYYISTVINQMIKNNKKFIHTKLENEDWICLGTPKQVDEFKKTRISYLFDLDGTMIITDEIYFKIWSEILKKYNIELTLNLYDYAIRGNDDKTACKLLNIDYNISITEIKNQNFDLNIDKIKLVNGIINFINEIKKNNNNFGIITNCNRQTAENILKYFNINPDLLIIGNECKQSKPSPEPYLKAMLYFNTSKYIIFEDSKTGIESMLESKDENVLAVVITTYYKENHYINENKNMNNVKNYVDLYINDYNYSNKYFEKILYYRQSIQFTLNNNNFRIKQNNVRLGYISDILELTINDSEYILKIETNSELSNNVKEIELFENEYNFYNKIKHICPINIPQSLGIIYDKNYKSVGIILENLYKKEYECSINLNNNLQLILLIIKNISELHTKFWNCKSSNIFKLKSIDDISKFMIPFIKDRIQQFKIIWKHVFNNEQIDILYNNFIKACINLNNNNQTIIHGDLKSPNIFYNNKLNKLSFIDWQYNSYGKGIMDIIFLLIESLDSEYLNIHYNVIIEYYYNLVSEKIVYDKNEYYNDIKDAICFYPFFVSIWFGTLDINILRDKSFPEFFIKKFKNILLLNNIINE